MTWKLYEIQVSESINVGVLEHNFVHLFIFVLLSVTEEIWPLI